MSAKTGVMTYERYEQYQQSYYGIQNQFDGTQGQLDQLKQRYQDMLSSYQSERDELSNKINSGNYDNADVKRRSVLDEKLTIPIFKLVLSSNNFETKVLAAS